MTLFKDAVDSHKDFINYIARDTLVGDADFSKQLRKIMKICMYMKTLNLSQAVGSRPAPAVSKGRPGNKMDEERRPGHTGPTQDMFDRCKMVNDSFDKCVKDLLKYMEQQ